MNDKQFPERDLTKAAEQQGIFRKFEVRRMDGSDQPGGKHYGCRYYVLDLDHDQHAPAAMRAYAAACASTHPELAADIEREFGAERAVSPAESVQSIEYDADFAPDDDSNKDVKEAYQQGRAFAMKELEAKLEAAARDKDGNHVDDLRGWLDEAKEQYEAQDVAFHACSLKLKQAEEELAKEKERADRAEAKIKADDEAARIMFNDLRKARDEQAQRADAAIAGCKRWCGDGECKDACVDRDAQPSDNLQQASTAQGEPLDCVTCKGIGQIGGWVGQTAESGGYDSIDCPDCTPAASATDAGLRLRGKASPEFLAEFAAAQATPEGGQRLQWSDETGPNNECRYNHVSAKTPFGRILITWKGWKDPRDYSIDEHPVESVVYWNGNTLNDTKHEAEQQYFDTLRAALAASQQAAEPLTFDRRWSLARDGFGLERNDESGEYVSHDDAVQVIHANLAVTTAAEPVYQVASLLYPGAWHDTTVEAFRMYNDGTAYKTRTLYRAAPPQRGMTAIAEMKRSAAGGALYLQTLIPPHMIPEGTKLYRVDGDTGGLPG